MSTTDRGLFQTRVMQQSPRIPFGYEILIFLHEAFFKNMPKGFFTCQIVAVDDELFEQSRERGMFQHCRYLMALLR